MLDFQSLYPSIMIAYNICYSTCLGSLKEVFSEGNKRWLIISQIRIYVFYIRFGVLKNTRLQLESLFDIDNLNEENLKKIA